MQVKRLSSSRVTTFLICPYRYYCQYCLELWKPANIALAIGTVFHDTTKHNYLQKCDTYRDLPLDDVLAIFSAGFDEHEIELRQGEDRGIEKDSGIMLLAEYQSVIAYKIQPVEVEQMFTMTFSNKPWPFTGRVDLVSDDGIVIENKTTARGLNRPRDTHLLQTYGYTSAMRRKLQSPDMEARIDYGVRGKVPRILSFPVEVTEAEERYFLTLLSGVAKGIEAEIWYANRVNNNLCSQRYCRYWQECEAENGGRVKP